MIWLGAARPPAWSGDRDGTWALPTVIGGPAVLVAVRIGVTESVRPVTYAALPLGVIAMPKGSFPTGGQAELCISIHDRNRRAYAAAAIAAPPIHIGHRARTPIPRS